MHEAVRTYEQRDVQTDCLEAIKQARSEGHNSGLINMATGLGKTYIAGRDVKDFLREDPNARVLYVCHNTDILRQARSTFEKVLGTDVGHGYVFDGQSNDQQQIVYASFQTLNGRDKLYQALDPQEFDYVIDDESHHAMARTHREVLGYLKPKFLLGLSATPERRDGRDIMDIFGREIYRKTLEAALAEGLLTPVNYKTFTDHLQQVEDVVEMIERIGMGKLNKTLFIPRRDEEIAEILFDEIAQIPNPHGLVFAQSIEHAERMAALLPGAAAIHSRLSPGNERELKEAFMYGEYPIAVVVDKYNEGVDIPSVNFLAPLRSTTSFRIWRQQLGRGLRRYEGKDEVRVADLAPSFERIQMILDLEAGVRRAKQGESVEVEPRNMNPGVNFDFSPEARDAISIIKQARTSYESSRDRYGKPLDGITALDISYENPEGETKELHLEPEEVLFLKAIWTSADGQISTKDLQGMYQQQFKLKIKQQELYEHLRKLVDRKILANVAFIRGDKSSKLWRLSNDMTHLLSENELFGPEYDQAIAGLHQVLATRVNQAFDDKGTMPNFIDFIKTKDDPNDQLMILLNPEHPFSDPENVELRGNLGGFAGEFEESDVTGPEIEHLLNVDHWDVSTVRALKGCRVATNVFVRKDEVIIHYQITGGREVKGYGQVPYYQTYDRKLTPGEINEVTQIISEYSELLYAHSRKPVNEAPKEPKKPAEFIDDDHEELYVTLAELDEVRQDHTKSTSVESWSEPAEYMRIDHREADNYEAMIIANWFKEYPDLLERVKGNPKLLEAIEERLAPVDGYSQAYNDSQQGRLEEIKKAINAENQEPAEE